METDIPSELRCPISQDLMNDPVTVTHHGEEFNFDRICIETWKTTPGGDQNPLTMLDGFRDASIKENLVIKEKVRAFRVENGMDINQETEKVTLEPFSDYQQIQDDEAEARRLHYELNGQPPLRTPDGRVPNQVRVTWIDEQGENREQVVNLPEILVRMMDAVPESRNFIMNHIVDIAMNPDSWLDAMDQGINMEVPVSETESNAPPVVAEAQPAEPIPVQETGIFGLRRGFLN
jgi:hypothetical protein